MTIQRSVRICEFAGGGVTAWQTARYVAHLAVTLENHPNVKQFSFWNVSDTPITMGRNKALQAAEKDGVDYVLMIDNDMVPDYYLTTDEKQKPIAEQEVKPFFESSFEFMLKHDAPCVVAAPYCGPPPHECCYVFQWVEHQNDDPNGLDFAIEMYPRSLAMRMTGIQPAAALPTGLILIDMRAVARLKHPRFYYEWTDDTETKKASTEDVAFTRDLTLLDPPVKIFCNWDCWAGHIKPKVVGMPEMISPQSIPRIMRKANKIHEQTGEALPRPESRVRPINRFDKIPKNHPIRLVRTLPLPAEDGKDDEYVLNTEPLPNGAVP